MSNKGNRKQTDINHVRGLAKKLAYEIKSDIDIIKTSKVGIGTCYDVVESRKNKGSKVETVVYNKKVIDVRDDSSEDILQDIGDDAVRKPVKKATKKAKQDPIIDD